MTTNETTNLLPQEIVLAAAISNLDDSSTALADGGMLSPEIATVLV
jgi:hypothetical protein